MYLPATPARPPACLPAACLTHSLAHCLQIAVSQATGAVFNIVGGPDLSLGDVQMAASVINDAMAPDSMTIFGALVDDRLKPGSDVTVTMVATGFITDDGSEGCQAPVSASATAPSSEAFLTVQPPEEKEENWKEVAPARNDDLPEFLTRLKRKTRR